MQGWSCNGNAIRAVFYEVQKAVTTSPPSTKVQVVKRPKSSAKDLKASQIGHKFLVVYFYFKFPLQDVLLFQHTFFSFLLFA